ncbi:hypothetical protein NEUTE1DRAFT_64351 [Neurospora tetrasperma FGSC 2508]|uniref:Tetraspanin Tsp3 n=1 Tax=Neurospora tetrasperma (strain FGSC 2508 / ATCC MYA-4615 / P0657) TaxID=510951 RepID=F8MRF6_NEUT8|nr:uncharacterized protein NEUTE1DRAFT_64351 [Neurospora tetrasperma FGSC 2508]EGO56065.1 hypothetical protein NEUTE1DRAFT_64351 [Neurospora tetrasperma FGSC 2508]EGZ71088.1 hypothetical protein NEUTE2DRAFT_114424 [Neurospora tetrasperma FGSC 2509]
MITLGLVYTLIILTLLAFAIYEHIHAQSLSLPISPGLTILTILLPILSALNTAYLYRVTTTTSPNQQNPPKFITAHSSSTITPNPSNPSQQLTHLRPAHAPRRPQQSSTSPGTLRSLLPTLSQTLQTTQLVLSLILLSVATSSLTSSPFSSFPNSGPGSIEHCALEQTWSHFFRAHDADTIRKIQDILGCCGFRSPKHMSWPFPSAGKGTEQCGQMWPGRREGCAGKWEGEFRGVMGGEIGVVAGVLVVQILGWGVGRWMATRRARTGATRRRGGRDGRATMGGRGREGSGMVNGEGRDGQGGDGNNSWWNKLLQSFGVPHGDEENGYRGLEDGEAQRRPLLGAGQNGEGHVGIEEVDDDEDGEGRDVERGGSDEESRSGSERRGGNGYGSATSRVQPSGIHVADPWAEGN